MATPELAGIPVLILKEGASRSRGREAQHANILAAQIVAETVKSALGPKGMDKMLVDSIGDVTITSDGRTIRARHDPEGRRCHRRWQNEGPTNTSKRSP